MEVVDLTIEVQSVVAVHDYDHVAVSDLRNRRTDTPRAVQLQVVHTQGYGSIEFGFSRVPRFSITSNLARDPETTTSSNPSPFQSQTVGQR